jgi:hypothetical protein
MKLKLFFPTHKYVSPCLVQPYFRLVNMKAGVMSVLARASPILVNGLNRYTVA